MNIEAAAEAMEALTRAGIAYGRSNGRNVGAVERAQQAAREAMAAGVNRDVVKQMAAEAERHGQLESAGIINPNQ